MAAYFSTASDSLHCTWWCKDWMQLVTNGNPWSSFQIVPELIWRPHGVWRCETVQLCWKCASSSQYGSVWPSSVILHHFMAEMLFSQQSLPLHIKLLTVDWGIFSFLHLFHLQPQQQVEQINPNTWRDQQIYFRSYSPFDHHDTDMHLEMPWGSII